MIPNNGGGVCIAGRSVSFERVGAIAIVLSPQSDRLAKLFSAAR
jgi:hypothetical protein